MARARFRLRFYYTDRHKETQSFAYPYFQPDCIFDASFKQGICRCIAFPVPVHYAPLPFKRIWNTGRLRRKGKCPAGMHAMMCPTNTLSGIFFYYETRLWTMIGSIFNARAPSGPELDSGSSGRIGAIEEISVFVPEPLNAGTASMTRMQIERLKNPG